MEEVKLQECGCGHKPAMVIDTHAVGRFSSRHAQVMCFECGERGPLRFGRTMTEAARAAAIAWNDRREEEIRRGA